MKVSDLLKNTQKTLFTFEILPPLKGGSFVEIQRIIEPLLEFAPSYINVTSHRADIAYRKKPDGETERVLIKKRPGNAGVAASVKFKYGIEVVPHVICAGFTRDQIEDELIDFHYLEMENLLVLRGDKMRSELMFIAENGGYAHAIDLLKQVQNMNRGVLLHSETEVVTPTSFSCGVAGYPEKHSDAPNFEQDLHYLKEKVDAGADYIVTQMFFDNTKYFEFVRRCREIGITVPIVPGVKPIATASQVDVLPKLFNVTLPEPLEHALRLCKTNADAKNVGTEWLIAQAKELKQANVPAIHIYTFGIPDNVVKVCKSVF
ncbi:MAG: methylenetetrahydrofolate reductase [Dysgonamonadaceae bacterium]|jgi:methylenetetrahydrofolate reductase (NADPH)|nr:methylenetetrahydrofolate reductase [Dysgonamonadaceae bacterium]